MEEQEKRGFDLLIKMNENEASIEANGSARELTAALAHLFVRQRGFRDIMKEAVRVAEVVEKEGTQDELAQLKRKGEKKKPRTDLNT